MVTEMTETSKVEYYKPSIGKRWFLLILSSMIVPGGIGLFISSWLWILRRIPPAPDFDRSVIIMISFVSLALVIGWFNELRKLIHETWPKKIDSTANSR